MTTQLPPAPTDETTMPMFAPTADERAIAFDKINKILLQLSKNARRNVINAITALWE